MFRPWKKQLEDQHHLFYFQQLKIIDPQKLPMKAAEFA
jgi:hypothetical protein